MQMLTSLITDMISPKAGGPTGSFPPNNGALEDAMVAQLGGFYTVETYQVFDIDNFTSRQVSCVIGNYIDTEADLPTPFLAVNTAGEGVADSPNWVVTGFRAIMDMGVNPAGMKEQAGLFGIAEITNRPAVNWDCQWVVCGHVWDSSAPASMSPIIITVKLDGTTNIMSSQIGGILPPLSWELTSFGSVNIRKPTMLCDLVYDAPNDRLVAVGNCVSSSNPAFSYSMYVELVKEGSPPTYIYNINYGISTDADYPAFLRSCSIQTQDAAGATVANRTIVTAVGFKDNTNYGTWAVYQPNYSNAWGGNPRWAFLEKGTNQPADFYSQQGLDTNDTPTYLTFCKRLTADGEDIYLICGISPNGIFAYAVSGLQTDSTGGGYDNIINNTGVSTTLRFLEVENEMTLFRNNTKPAFEAFTNLATATITDAVALADRKTKLYATGYDENGRNASLDATSFIGSYTMIYAVSRGLKKASTKIAESGIEQQVLKTQKGVRLKMDLFNQSTADKLAFSIASYRPLATNASALWDFTTATGRRAVAWFEYLMYDGIDALVAKKLHEMGVRVTIANVEWYKQEILKERLDVSSDFFTEWATAQEEQNQERDKLNRLQGNSRPRKRQVRTEIFDDYADMEEKEAAVKNFPDYDPFKDGEPFKDDVAKEQEIQKTQKAVDDLRRIEDNIDEIAEVQSEQREQDDAYDIGDNEEP
tara:strand:- start:10072 stop:12177 length:2106 start_codon:yes stop_codon:yes gene_type:complete